MGAPGKTDSPTHSLAAALQAWVEVHRPPDQVIGHAASTFDNIFGAPDSAPPKERLVCAFPAEAVLMPKANPDNGSSYACETR
jgi:hypothetical protein